MQYLSNQCDAFDFFTNHGRADEEFVTRILLYYLLSYLRIFFLE